MREVATGALERQERRPTLTGDILQAKILMVDDEDINLTLLDRILRRAGYDNLCATHDSREALPLFRRFNPDIVLLDLHMPHYSGLEVIEQLQSQVDAASYLPIVVLTADMSAKAEQEALSRGAKEFLNKPFRAPQITLRVRNLLETRSLHIALQQQNELLEEKVEERTAELELARLELLDRLALAAEYRDHDTARHTQRVGELSAMLAAQLELPMREVVIIRRAATLHDVGKIGIPDSILLKPGPLSKDEFETMKEHTNIGMSLLSNGKSEVIRMAELIARTHHERYDGLGYPNGLKGHEIPIVGQIVSVVDVFDTLVNQRPYKEAWPVEKAVAEIRKETGKRFDPKVVAAFFQVLAAHVWLVGKS